MLSASWLSESADLSAKSTRESPTTGAEYATAYPAPVDRPLRDDDAIDPLSGRHGIIQGIVIPEPYSKARAGLAPARVVAPAGHGNLLLCAAVVRDTTVDVRFL